MATGIPFFDHPILNSPYECPSKHWELDPDGQPTQQVFSGRREAKFVTPIPKPRKRTGRGSQAKLALEDENGLGLNLSSDEQEYNTAPHPQRASGEGECVATASKRERLGSYTGNRPAAPALAALRFSEHTSILLPGRGGGNEWLRSVAEPDWFARYGSRVENFNLPKTEVGRKQLATVICLDGRKLLNAVGGTEARLGLASLPEVLLLERVWEEQFVEDGGGQPCLRDVDRMKSPAELT